MLNITGYDIELSRGDSMVVRVSLAGRDLPHGTDAIFTIRKQIQSEEPILQKRFDASDESVTIILHPNETDLTPGTYFWDLRLQIPSELGGYEVVTPMDYAAFVVLDIVGHDIGTADDPGTNPDLPVLQQILLEARDAIDRSNAATGSAVQATQSANQSASSAAKAAEDAATAADEASAIVSAMNAALLTKVDDGYVENGYLYLTAGGSVVVGPLGPFGSMAGGNGGVQNGAQMTMQNKLNYLAKTIALGADCMLRFAWSSLEDGISTGGGTLFVTVNDTLRLTRGVSQGDVEVDVSAFLSAGSNSVRLKVQDAYGNARQLTYSLSAVEALVESKFDASTPFTGAVTYAYTPIGAVEKTMHFVLNGTEISTEVITASGRQQSFLIPAQAHGSHSFCVFYTAIIDGETVTSNALFYDLMFAENENNTPIIASAYQPQTTQQHANVVIHYRVYVADSQTAPVQLKVNGEVVKEVTADRTEQNWTQRLEKAGSNSLQIVCGNTVKTFLIPVVETDMDVEAETNDLRLHLSSHGRSNSEADPAVWVFGDVSASLTGFNWVSDGWQSDADGNTVLRVSGDGRVTIPYKLFAEDCRRTGKTIELEFATHHVLDYDAVIVSCMSGGRGLEVTAQKAMLKSEQSEIFTQYKENEHLRVSFVIEKRAENRLIYLYVNGILSGVTQYPDGDDFSQGDPADIVIGSNHCSVDLYGIRVYDNSLTRHQVLDNWIADTQDMPLRMERYARNRIFDAYGRIVIDRLPADLPYFIAQSPALPAYKGNKLEQAGTFTNPTAPDKSFTFTAAQADVQGTSSAEYARKNFKFKFLGGFEKDGVNYGTVLMFENGVATSVYTFKADVASSEGANNVELVRLYNAICPYQTPPQKTDARIRQGIDGFPMVMFHDKGEGAAFIGKYNFNNDKGTPEVFGFTEGDESWEIRNNTSDRVLFQNADFSGDGWLNDFEARYPEGNTNAANLAAFAGWIQSTDRTAATGTALVSPVIYDGMTYAADTEACRLARFRAELSEHAEVESALFYYLFTSLFLMVDSRAKNAFPTRYHGGKWCWLPYDMDTALGINNEGKLVFGYHLEDMDTMPGGADVFNGQQSVFWRNLRDAFPNEIAAMYQQLRSENKLSYELVEGMFEAHQQVWPEAIWNEDAWVKYLEPLVKDGSGAYLGMLQGSKSQQRKWWLYNRFRYMDSKYHVGDALPDVITLRGYAAGDITVTPYADIYAAIKYGSYLVQKRTLRGSSYTLPCPLDYVNDTEIYIYSASQLKELGDLSALKVGYAEFANATRLQTLKLGDASPDYTNPNLTELYLGNNTLLQTLDVRNCPNLGLGTQKEIDLSGCTNMEHVYFDGTSIQGVTLPNGGMLKTLHLPETITNLTIRNHASLTDMVLPGYANIATLWVENTPCVPAADILASLADNSRVRLMGFEWQAENVEAIFALYNKLDRLRGLDENGGNMIKPQVSGVIHVPFLTGAQLAQLQSRYPYLTIDYGALTTALSFYSDDGSTLLSTVSITGGGDGAYDGELPAKESTEQYAYTFAGWSTTPGGSVDANALKAVTADRSVYAVFTPSLRKYNVYYYNGDTLLQTVPNVTYGESAAYTGDTPTKTGVTRPEDYVFSHFAPDGSHITGTTYCYAQYTYTGIAETITDSWDQILAAEADGTYATKYHVKDTKLLDLGEQGVVAMQIAAIDTDDLADGSGKARMTWISEQLLKTSRQMNPERTTLWETTQQSATTDASSNTGVDANTTKTISFRQRIQDGETAEITANVIATADGTLTLTYTGVSAAYGKLSIDVNGQNLVTDHTGSTAATHTMAVASGDAIAITARYASLNFNTTSKASIKLSSTGAFALTTTCNTVLVNTSAGYAEGTGCIGGWEQSDLRMYLKDTVMPLLPDNVRTAIKPVTKTQPAYNTTGTSLTQTSTEDVWIPAIGEVFGQSAVYAGLFEGESANIMKKKTEGASGYEWWLRDGINSGQSWGLVCNKGAQGNSIPHMNRGVVLCFCT